MVVAEKKLLTGRAALRMVRDSQEPESGTSVHDRTSHTNRIAAGLTTEDLSQTFLSSSPATAATIASLDTDGRRVLQIAIDQLSSFENGLIELTPNAVRSIQKEFSQYSFVLGDRDGHRLIAGDEVEAELKRVEQSGDIRDQIYLQVEPSIVADVRQYFSRSASTTAAKLEEAWPSELNAMIIKDPTDIKGSIKAFRIEVKNARLLPVDVEDELFRSARPIVEQKIFDGMLLQVTKVRLSNLADKSPPPKLLVPKAHPTLPEQFHWDVVSAKDALRIERKRDSSGKAAQDEGYAQAYFLLDTNEAIEKALLSNALDTRTFKHEIIGIKERLASSRLFKGVMWTMGWTAAFIGGALFEGAKEKTGVSLFEHAQSVIGIKSDQAPADPERLLQKAEVDQK